MTYREQVYQGLIQMKNSLIISENVKNENREVFISIVKDFIRSHDPVDYLIEFSSDYLIVFKKYKAKQTPFLKLKTTQNLFEG